MSARTQIQGKRIVIDGDRGNRSAVRPQDIVDQPAARKFFVLEHAVIGDHVSGDFLYAARRDSVGEFSENFFGRSFALLFLVIRKFPVGEIRVAAADQNEIAVQHTVRIERAVRRDGGAHAIVRAERGEGERRGK